MSHLSSEYLKTVT